MTEFETITADIRAAIMRALERCDRTSDSHDWIANEAMETVRDALSHLEARKP